MWTSNCIFYLGILKNNLKFIYFIRLIKSSFAVVLPLLLLAFVLIRALLNFQLIPLRICAHAVLIWIILVHTRTNCF